MAMLTNPQGNKAIDSGLARLSESIALIVERKQKGNVPPDEVMELVTQGKTVLLPIIESINENIRLLDDPRKDDLESYIGAKANETMQLLETLIEYNKISITFINSIFGIAKSTKAFYPFENIIDGYFKEVVLKISALINYNETLLRQCNQHLIQLPTIEDEKEFSSEDKLLFSSYVSEFNKDLEAGSVQCQK